MKKFIKFLEENNAWENFERAFRNYGRDVRDYKKQCKVFKNIELDGAFEWQRTKEGISYWNKLNDKWIQENESLKEQLLSND